MNDKPIKGITHEDYNRLSDDVFDIGNNAILRFTVNLYSKNKDGNRESYHKEFRYPNKDKTAYNITLRRSFDYYLSIENIYRPENEEEKAFIMITVSDFILFKESLDTVSTWFRSSKFSKLFAKSNNKLIVTAPVPKSLVNLSVKNKYIKFEPTVIPKGNTDSDLVPGIIMYLSSETNYVTMDINRFMGLYYSVSTFNMFQIAQQMVNYLGRPEFGTNVINMGDEIVDSIDTRTNNVEELKTESVSNRKIKTKKQTLEDIL